MGLEGARGALQDTCRTKSRVGGRVTMESITWHAGSAVGQGKRTACFCKRNSEGMSTPHFFGRAKLVHAQRGAEAVITEGAVIRRPLAFASASRAAALAALNKG